MSVFMLALFAHSLGELLHPHVSTNLPVWPAEQAMLATYLLQACGADTQLLAGVDYRKVEVLL